MLRPLALFGLVAAAAAAVSCPEGSSCALAKECRRRLNDGGATNVAALPRCGFDGSFPQFCCPLTSTQQRPTLATARPSTPGTTPRTTAAPATTATTKRPAPPSSASSALLGAKPAAPVVFLRENATDVRFGPATPPPTPAPPSPPLLAGNNYSSISYPGANQVNSGHGGPVTFEQAEVVRPGSARPPPRDLLRHPNVKLLPVERCGRNADESTERIHAGAQQASLGEYPWVAQLGELRGNNFRVMCGGSVISRRYILTAGQCIRPELTHVRLGEYNTNTDPDCFGLDECADLVSVIQVEEKIRHERYDKPYSQNDVGLIRLKRPLSAHFSSYIKPVCIPLKPEVDVVNDVHRTKLITVGWGLSHSVSKPIHQILKEAQLPLVKNKDCGNMQVLALHKNIADTQLCAGSSEDSSTACQGDTGGPLMLLTHGYGGLSDTAVYMQVGVASHGPDECGVAAAPPAIFTRVSSYAEWILDHIRQ
ncbi:CLIP domain-containing serine protease HP8-like [Neocloeon triangulifer]|uniref:CLIP domain-containing serine protease HP8-like n=1 Tax=Neocloeon triangulifer TaxID=2078957 RepID=UPI00286ECADE|nr:CLIP domain-containing serine protease HP8-like [Neocloeon triangulifer]